jgi:hypothetical protein
MASSSRWQEVLVLVCLVAGSVGIASHALAANRKSPELVTLAEAEILMYLLPHAHENRSNNRDVASQLQTSPQLNQTDFYCFWVTGTNPPAGTGSVTVGYFAVNKHTADIQDYDDEPVKSPELGGVQEIIRRAHGIDSRTVAKYRDRKVMP